MNNQAVVNAYKQVDIGAAVASASPAELISMLMAGSLKRILEAKGAIERDDSAAKGVAISKAIGIVTELQGSLEGTNENEVATNLNRLYDYMLRTLIAANAESSTEKLDEVAQLMIEVKAGWDGMEVQA